MDPRLVEEMLMSAGADGRNEKCCWYPFKKAHMRRRIHSDVYLNKNDPNDVQLYGGGGSNDDDNVAAAYRNLQGSADRGVLAGRQSFHSGVYANSSSGTNPWQHQAPNTTSIVHHQSTIGPDCVAKQYNCTNKEFWIDDVSPGKLWAFDNEEEEKREREPLKLKSALKKPTRQYQNIPPPHPDLQTSPIPKIEVVHEPRQQRRRSVGSSNSQVDDDAEKLQQIRHSFFGLANGDIDPLVSRDHRREPTLQEEKKEEDPLHLLEMPELKDSAAPRPSTRSARQQPIGRSRSFSLPRKPVISTPRRNNDNTYRARNFPETRISVVSNAKPPPQSASAEERPRITRSRSLSSKRNKKTGLVGGSRHAGDRPVRQRRAHVRTIRTPAIEVQATRSQLDSVKDQFDDEHEPPPPEQSLLRNVRVIGGEPLSPCPDLEVVRQSSLVDNDSAFMGSEISAGETPSSPIGDLLSSIISKASRRKASRSLASPRSKHSQRAVENKAQAAGRVPMSLLTASAGSCTKSAGDDDDDDDEESSCCTSSSFNPPREIKSDWTSARESRDQSSKQVSEESKAKSDGNLVRNISNAYSYKKSMSEKVSRRLRSRDFKNRNHHNDSSDPANERIEISTPSTALTSKKARPFQRQPISALTTTSNEIYSVAFRKPPVSPDGIRRDHISELTTVTTKKNQRSRTNGSSIFGNLMKAMSRSEDDIVMEEEDPISVSASAGLPAIGSHEWSKSELFAGSHHTPRPEEWSSPIQASASPRSPERAAGSSGSSERAPKSQGTQKSSKLDFFAEDMKAFFEDFSTVGTSAFDDVEDTDDDGGGDDDDEDSIFSDLRSADSSQLYTSKGSVEASTLSPPVSRTASEKVSRRYISRQKMLRKGSLFRKGDMLSDGSSAFEDEYGCMDNWLE